MRLTIYLLIFVLVVGTPIYSQCIDRCTYQALSVDIESMLQLEIQAAKYIRGAVDLLNCCCSLTKRNFVAAEETLNALQRQVISFLVGLQEAVKRTTCPPINTCCTGPFRYSRRNSPSGLTVVEYDIDCCRPRSIRPPRGFLDLSRSWVDFGKTKAECRSKCALLYCIIVDRCKSIISSLENLIDSVRFCRQTICCFDRGSNTNRSSSGL